MLPIDGPTLPLVVRDPQATSALQEKPEKVDGFGDLLKNVVATANERIQAADQAGEAFAAGQRDDIHGTMLALSKAEIELRMVGTMRNKVVDAFYEIWRMNI